MLQVRGPVEKEMVEPVNDSLETNPIVVRQFKFVAVVRRDELPK